MMRNLQKSRVWTFLVLILLSASFSVQAQVGTLKQAAKDAKISPDLYQVMQNRGPLPPAAPIGGGAVETNQVIVGDRIAIEAVANNDDGEGLLNQLRALGLTEGVAYKRKIFGYLPIAKLGDLKNVSSLSFADSFYKPETNTGSVTSQGDAALKADIARTTYGVTGAGVKVGILSDSYNRLNGQATGIGTNDLPAAGVQVLEEYTGTGPTDEGRAMAEIIYDVAPGAAMAFNTAFNGEAGFAQGIINLATTAGCQIIVDDIGYLNAPMFQDGIVAQAVNQVVNNNGVTYFSAAANQARSSYQAPYKSGGTYTNTSFYGTSTAYPTHNFAASGVDNLQQITVPNNGQLRLAFQWDNPYQSISGGTGATTDLDILILNSTTGALLTFGARDQSAGGDPWEITGTYTNTTGAPVNVNVVIVKYSGPDPGLIKWVNYGSRTIIPEYDTKSSTSFGHANAAGAIGVGAAAYFQTPVFNGQSTATIENFSSAGGTPILFNTNGTRINGIIGTVRQKPEITSVDGGDNTFFGGDYEPNGKPNFFGTSAAAPHAAAVAALMKQKVPAITRNTILSVMETTALDMDDPSTTGFDTGFDFGTGYGFIQADKALQALSPTALSLVVTANPTMILTTGTTTLSATVSGGTTPYSYTFSGPGTITPSGNTATVSNLMAGVQTFTVRAKDATSPTSQTISGTVSVTVNMAPPANTPPTVANAVPPQSATVGVAYTLSLANVFTDAETPTMLTLSVSGLPAGLNFTPPSTISGTPSMSGVSTVTVKATDPGSLTATNSFNITVSPAPTTPPTPGSFAIVGVTTVSCTTLSAGQRALTFSPQYSGLDGTPVSFSVANELLPTTAPGPYTLSLYTDNPVITLKATQNGTQASFAYNWLVVCGGTTPPPPPPTPTGTFSITGVTTVSCTTVSAGLRTVSFTPRYAGLDGTPVSFSVANELLPTTAPGPYTLNLYTDNPVITLKATQSGTQASFAYNWIVACNGGAPGGPSARVGAGSELTSKLKATILPNPVSQEFRIRIEGAQGQAVRLELSDLSGHSMLNKSVDVSSDDHQESLRFSEPGRGMYLLRVSTGQQAVTLKVIRE